MKEQGEVVVIGSGPGGYTSAIRASQKGMKVILIEEEKTGGTCLNRGCIPTKALIRDGLLFGSERKVSQELVEKIFLRKDQIVEKMVAGIEKQLMMRGISIIRGKGTLKGDRTVEVRLQSGELAEAAGSSIVIATGAKAAPEQGIDWDGKDVMSTDDAIHLKKVPRSLAVIGGGKRSVEFAGFFRALGCEVTVIEEGGQLLPGFDKELTTRLRRILTEKKISLKLNCAISKVDRSDKKGPLLLSVETKKGLVKIEVDKVLMPGKRTGFTEGLGLEKAGVAVDQGFIKVKSNLETSVGGIFSVGDATGGRLSAHKALFEGMAVVDHIMGGSRKIRYDLVPQCVWGDPEVASIGLTQQEAEEEGREIEIGKFPFMASGRANTLDQVEGVVKVISGRKYGEILGVHILGPQATELIALAGMAMKNELGIEEIRDTLFAHPTLSESFFEASLDVRGEAIHMMKGF